MKKILVYTAPLFVIIMLVTSLHCSKKKDTASTCRVCKVAGTGVDQQVIQKQVCSDTGFFPTAGTPGTTCSTRLEYFIKGNEKNSGSVESKDVWLDKTTQDLPKKGQTDNLELKNASVYTDPTGDQYCLSCPHPTPTLTPTPAP